MLAQYIPVLITFALALIVVTVMVNANRFLSPRNKTPTKLETFECGNEPSGSAWGRFSVKFYLTAILFIVFDVEVVFMYPYAVVFRQLGWGGFAAMAIFLFVAVIGLLYEWRKGALQWE
ncbi:MAG TPA: NADH-quinone oxidoreductase subunit A [Candidatus Dormibacteraeota bacterium]|nr:NADH-quinone oxidoreductase subunit A [Candidatus Dormibacteraeota bacterium]